LFNDVGHRFRIAANEAYCKDGLIPRLKNPVHCSSRPKEAQIRRLFSISALIRASLRRLLYLRHALNQFRHRLASIGDQVLRTAGEVWDGYLTDVNAQVVIKRGE